MEQEPKTITLPGFEVIKPTAADTAPSLNLPKAKKPRKSKAPIQILDRPGFGPFNLAKGAKVSRILTEWNTETEEWLNKETGWIGLDLQTAAGSWGTALDVWKGVIAVLGLYGPEHETAVVINAAGYLDDPIIEWLNRGHKFTTHNGATFDLLYLINAGVNVFASEWFDSLIGEQVVAGTDRKGIKKDLQSAVKRRLGVDISKLADQTAWLTENLTETQTRYVAEDISFLPALREAHYAKADETDSKWGKNEFYGTGVRDALDFEMKLLNTTVRMEARGIPLDYEALMSYNAAQVEEAASSKARLDELFGDSEINWGSWQQIKKQFLNKFGAVLVSTKEEDLKDMADLLAGSEVAEAALTLVKYKHAIKRSGMYNEDFFQKYTVSDAEGFPWLRGRFRQTGTDTGRYSSADPNMQQFPKDKGEGNGMRHVFGNHPDFDIVAIDYSQIEVRIAANEAEDDALITLLGTDDIHRMIASRVFGVPPEQVSKDQRQLSKAMSFCLIFGGGAYTLQQYAKMYGADLPVSKATPLILDFFDQFRGLYRFKQRAIAIANRGYPFTLNFPTGMRRVLTPGLDLKPTRILNNIVQATAAAGLKYALVEAQGEGLDEFIGAVVHDEIVSAVPKPYSAEFADKLMGCMVRGMERVCEKAPVKAEATIGATWG
jgi:DNA polymerase-1